jgi:hypothetical protein
MNKAKAAIGTALMFFSLAAAFQLQASANSSDNFIFKFDPKLPLVYSLKTRVEVTTYMAIGGQTENPNRTKVATESRYKMRFTPTAGRQRGATAVRYEPFDYECDMESTGSSGHFLTNVRGLQVKATQNGITVIDTDKDIGVSQAKNFKSEAVPLLLSGEMDLGDNGFVKDIRGDLPFVDFWKNLLKSQTGLMGIVFPDHPVAKEESWQTIIPMKTMGQVKLQDEGLSCTNTFTRHDDIDKAGRTVTTFVIASPLRCRDLTGYIEQGGQSTSVNITELERHTTGTVHFDQERGVLVDTSTTATATAAMTTLIQGRALSMRMEMRMDYEVRRIDASEKKTEAASKNSP